MAESNNGEGTETDRISNLPDSVLLHVLSFLPTKTCVSKMSLVSRRWRYLWKHLQVLDFNDNYHREYNHEEFEHFTVFVNAVLALRRTRDIRKMRLSCAHSQSDAFYAHSVDSWLCTAIGPHLEELHLTFFSIDGHGFRLPLTILTCPLVSLSLCRDILLQLPPSSVICLPSLKTLQLGIDFVDVNLVNVLLSGCPILETLYLSYATESSTRVRVPPSLKRLKVSVHSKIGTYLEIDSPCLKYLSITRSTVGYVAGNLHNVDEAYLDVFSTAVTESVDPLLNLLRALSGIKHLQLGHSTTKWLFRAPDIHFPEFRYVLHLCLDVPSLKLSFLYDVLQKCPMLQALTIQNFEEDPSSSSDGCVAQPECVPNCLLSHLTFIRFKEYARFPDELVFVDYILRNGLVLKTMLFAGLSLHGQENWVSFMTRLYEIPRGSAICQIKFGTKYE